MTEAEKVEAKIAALPVPPSSTKLPHNRLREATRLREQKEKELADLAAQLKDLEMKRDCLARDIIDKADQVGTAREALAGAARELCDLTREIAREASAEAKDASPGERTLPANVAELQALLVEAQAPADSEYEEFLAQRTEEAELEDPMNVHKYRLAKVLRAINEQIVRAQGAGPEQPVPTERTDQGTPAKRKLDEAFESDETSSGTTHTPQSVLPVGTGSSESPPLSVTRLSGMATRYLHTYEPTPY